MKLKFLKSLLFKASNAKKVERISKKCIRMSCIAVIVKISLSNCAFCGLYYGDCFSSLHRLTLAIERYRWKVAPIQFLHSRVLSLFTDTLSAPSFLQ